MTINDAEEQPHRREQRSPGRDASADPRAHDAAKARLLDAAIAYARAQLSSPRRVVYNGCYGGFGLSEEAIRRPRRARSVRRPSRHYRGQRRRGVRLAPRSAARRSRRGARRGGRRLVCAPQGREGDGPYRIAEHLTGIETLLAFDMVDVEVLD